MDADGYVGSATWWNGVQASRVRRIDPATGNVVFEVHMPDGTSRVTCCCFGGPELDILFITTAGEGSDATKEPHAGGLYAVKLKRCQGQTGTSISNLDTTFTKLKKNHLFTVAKFQS